MDRSKLKKLFIISLLGISGCVFAATFNRFSPANGVLVGDPSTYVTTAASSSNIRSLWSGTCDNTTYLRGDGACDTPSGSSVTPAALTKVDDTNVTLALGGTPATALLQSTSLTLGWSGQLSVPRGGSGAGSLTGYLIGNGTSPFTASATIPYTDLTGTPTLGSLAALSSINNTNWSGAQLTVPNGGTGAVTLTGYVKGSGTAALTASATIPYADLTGTPTLGSLAALNTINGSNWSGQDLAVADGGTGASTLTGYVKGSGTSAMTASATIPYSDLTGTPTLGTLAALSSINDGNWSGTDLAVANGGTGVSTLTGIAKGNGTSAFTAALSSDVIGLWTGTCNSTTFLRADGSCQTVSGGSGTVTSVDLTMPSGFSVSGNPVTSSGTLAVTTTLSGVIKGTGSGLTAAASADVTGLWSGSCSSSTFLRGDGTCASPGGATVTTNVNFTPTCTGYSACPAGANSGHYSITGAITCVFINNFSGTSNASGLTVTLPTAAKPVNNGAFGQAGFAIGADNGVRKQVTWRLSNSGVITFSNDALMNGTAFTSSGRKALEEDLNICFANS